MFNRNVVSILHLDMPWKKVIVIVTALITERVARDFGEIGTLVCI